MPSSTAQHRRWDGGWWLVGLLALGTAARWGMLASITQGPYRAYLQPDEFTYDRWARAILEGTPFPVFDQSSLPAYVMAAVYSLTGAEILHVRIANLVLGVGLCAVAYGIGRVLRGPGVGLLTGLVVALYQPFAFLSVTLLKEPLGLLLFGCTILFFLLAERARGHRRLLMACALGASLAFTVNLRQNVIFVAPVLVFFLVRWELQSERRPRAAAAVAGAAIAGFVVFSAPFVLLTYRQSGQLSPTPVGGFNLYLGNNLASGVPYYRPVPFATNVPAFHATQFAIEASRRVGHPLTGGQASSYWAMETVRSAAARPVLFARHLGLKLLALFNRWEEQDNHDLEFLAAYVPALRLPLLTFGMVLPLGLAGLLSLARRERRVAALAFAAAIYGASLVVVWPNARYRAPLVLILAPAAIAELVRLVSEKFPRRQVVAWAATAAAVLAVERVPVPGAGDHTAAMNGHAGMLFLAGRADDARSFLERSAAERGAYSDYALIALAAFRIRSHDFEAARTLLAQVPDGSFAASTRYDSLADLLELQGRDEEAVHALERSLAINSGDLEVHDKYVALLQKIDPIHVADAERKRHLIQRFYGAP